MKLINYLTQQSEALFQLCDSCEYLPLIATNSVFFKSSDFSFYKIGTNLNNNSEFNELKQFMYDKIKENVGIEACPIEKSHLMCFFLRDNCSVNSWNVLPLAHFKHFGLIEFKKREDVRIRFEQNLNISNDKNLILLQGNASVSISWDQGGDYSKHSVFACLWC